jgi:ribosome-binding protein aMBF1 (putative translation factor)
MVKLKKIDKIKKEWLKDPRVKTEYHALKSEFQIAEEIVKARIRANLTQAELAKKIGTKSTAISRIESLSYGRASTTMLKKIAYALGCDLQIRLVPKSR